MIICIPVEERVSAIIRSSYLVAKRTSETKYSLKGEAFQMCEITASQVIVLPDTADVTEGAAVTEEL